MATQVGRKIQISSTHIDSQNEAMSKQALESMVAQSQERAIWLGIEHDIILPPLGKMGNAVVEPLEDGHFGLFAEPIFYDDEDYVNYEVEIDNLDDLEMDVVFSNNPVSIAFNKHTVSKYSRYMLKDVPTTEMSEKSEHGDINFLIHLSFIAGTVFGVIVKEYTKGALEGLGIDVSDIGRRNTVYLKEKIKEITESVIGKTERAFISSEIIGKRVRIAYSFYVNKSEVLCIIPFDKEKLDSEKLRESIEAIPNLAGNLISKYTDLLEADKIIFVYDKKGNYWRFVFASHLNGKIIISDYGRIYQDIEQRKASRRMIESYLISAHDPAAWGRPDSLESWHGRDADRG